MVQRGNQKKLLYSLYVKVTLPDPFHSEIVTSSVQIRAQDSNVYSAEPCARNKTILTISSGRTTLPTIVGEPPP